MAHYDLYHRNEKHLVLIRFVSCVERMDRLGQGYKVVVAAKAKGSNLSDI